jgi:hypothetical protein
MHISRAGPRRSLSQRLEIARRRPPRTRVQTRPRQKTGVPALRTSAQRQRGRTPPANRHREAGRHPSCPDPRAPRPELALGRAVDARRMLGRQRARGDRRGRPHRRPRHDDGADGDHRPLRQLTPMTPLLTPPFHGERAAFAWLRASPKSRVRRPEWTNCGRLVGPRSGLAQSCFCVVGSPGASQPPAPSDPGVTVSRHRALLTSRSVRANPLPVGE